MSWEQLSTIYRENDEQIRRERDQPPTDCPNDGTNLDVGSDGTLHCSFDGWIWDGTSRT